MVQFGKNYQHEGRFGNISFRHGGDFVGLTSKLPYIKGLGCEVGVKHGVKHGVKQAAMIFFGEKKWEAVWISPIFQNGNNSYHQFLRLQAEVWCFGSISDSCWHFVKILVC